MFPGALPARDPSMPVRSAHKMEIVRTLVGAATDDVVGRLQSALAQAADDALLLDVRKLVDAEAEDRRLRNLVFGPLAGLSGHPTADTPFRFQPRVLSFLWRGLKAVAREDIDPIAESLRAILDEPIPADALDALTAKARAGLFAGEQADFRAAAQAADEAMDGGGDKLLICLELTPVVRHACLRLPEWINRTTQEGSAAARVAYRDAVDIHPNAGPLFFEMLAGQLAHPWLVLRVISAAMDRPPEGYMAGSEFADFGLRVLRAADAGLAQVVQLDLDAGPDGGRRSARALERLAEQLGELEAAIEMDRTGPWGGQAASGRRRAAEAVQSHFRDADKVFDLVFVMETVRTGRTSRTAPRLRQAPDAATANRLGALLAFVRESRASANAGGFAAARSKLVETVGEKLDDYVEAVLEAMRHEAQPHARAYLEAAAEAAALLRDTRAADIIRRRAAAAV